MLQNEMKPAVILFTSEAILKILERNIKEYAFLNLQSNAFLLTGSFSQKINLVCFSVFQLRQNSSICVLDGGLLAYLRGLPWQPMSCARHSLPAHVRDVLRFWCLRSLLP